MIIKNDKGEDVEVFTQEEAAALAEKKAKEAQEAKEAEFAKDREELEKLRTKDFNFEQLRKKAEGKGDDSEVKSQIEELSKKLDQVATQPIAETLSDFVREEVGEDKERKEKFEYYYKRLGAEAKTKDEVLRAAKEALTLATNGEYKSDGTSKMTGTGVSQNYRGDGQPRKRGDDFNDIAKALGNTEEDIKKYGSNN